MGRLGGLFHQIQLLLWLQDRKFICAETVLAGWRSVKLNPFRPDLIEEHAQLAEGYMSLSVYLPHIKTTLLMKMKKNNSMRNKSRHSCCEATVNHHTSMMEVLYLKLSELSCCRLLFKVKLIQKNKVRNLK